MKYYGCRMNEQQQKEYNLLHRLTRKIPALLCTECGSTNQIERHFIYSIDYIIIKILCHKCHQRLYHSHHH